jgi:hypothetical protein
VVKNVVIMKIRRVYWPGLLACLRVIRKVLSGEREWKRELTGSSRRR